MKDIEKIQRDVAKQLSKKEVLQTLVTTTFKGLDTKSVQLAIVEGMMRGFTFEDFLKRKVYALPFGSTYALVGGIDGAREHGMKGGIVGKAEPRYEEKDGKLVSCSVSVQKKSGDHIGEFTAKVYFDEYTTGKNLWISKPRTMLAKVAEMHALRMACPEELAQYYVEEELEQKNGNGKEQIAPVDPVDVDECRKKLETAENLDALKSVWSALPAEAKANKELVALKDELKQKYENPKV